MLKLRIEQAMGCASASSAGPTSAASQVDGGAESEAALATRCCHPPGCTAHSHEHDANACKDKSERDGERESENETDAMLELSEKAKQKPF